MVGEGGRCLVGQSPQTVEFDASTKQCQNLSLTVGHPGEGNDIPLQYSCIENSMDREAWWAMIHGVPKSWTQLSD